MANNKILIAVFFAFLLVTAQAAGKKGGKTTKKEEGETTAAPATTETTTAPAAAPAAKAPEAAPAAKAPEAAPAAAAPAPAPAPAAVAAPAAAAAPVAAAAVTSAVATNVVHEEVAAPSKESHVTASNAVSISIIATPTVSFIGVPFPIGVNLGQRVPTNLALRLIATGSDGVTVSREVKPGQLFDSFSIVPTASFKGSYSITFTIEGSAAGNYIAPPNVVFRLVENADILLLDRPWNFLHTGRVVEMEVFTGVPVPAFGGLDVTGLTLVATDNNGFSANIFFGRGDFVSGFRYTAPSTEGIYTITFAVQAPYDAIFNAPEPFSFAVAVQSPITLVGAETEVDLAQTVEIQAVLGIPIFTTETGDNSLQLTLSTSNGYTDSVVYNEEEYVKPLQFTCSQTPGSYIVYFTLGGNEAPRYYQPPSFTLICTSKNITQISVDSAPGIIAKDDHFPVTLNIGRAVPAGESLTVTATTSDPANPNVDFVFSGAITCITHVYQPKTPGPFSVRFATSGTAADRYVAPLYTGVQVLPISPVMALGVNTENYIGSSMQVNMAVLRPVEPGMALTITLEGTHGLGGSCTISEGTSTCSFNFPVGNVLGSFQGHFAMTGAGSDNERYVLPPDFGFYVVNPNPNEMCHAGDEATI